MRPKICGRKAAIVSVFQLGGMQLATNSPSCKAISAPATPGNVAVLWTISLGVQLRFPGSPKSSANSSPGFPAGLAAATGRGRGADGAGAGAETAGCTSGLDGAGAAAGPEALNKSRTLATAAANSRDEPPERDCM